MLEKAKPRIIKTDETGGFLGEPEGNCSGTAEISLDRASWKRTPRREAAESPGGALSCAGQWKGDLTLQPGSRASHWASRSG